MATRTLYDEDGNPFEVEIPDEGDSGQPQRTNAEWAQLRKATKRGDDLEKENSALKREMAFIRAGIDPTDDKARYFVKGYEGEPDVEAIRAEAVRVGILEAPPAPTDPTTDPIAQAGLEAGQRIAGASTGSTEEGASKEQRLDAAYLQGGVPAVLEEARKMGLTVVGTVD